MTQRILIGIKQLNEYPYMQIVFKKFHLKNKKLILFPHYFQNISSLKLILMEQ